MDNPITFRRVTPGHVTIISGGSAVGWIKDHGPRGKRLWVMRLPGHTFGAALGSVNAKLGIRSSTRAGTLPELKRMATWMVAEHQ